MPAVERRPTRYAPETVGVGIVHIGLGAFHRAHQAAYIEAWLNRNGGGDWGICAANVRSNRRIVEHLKAQRMRYHIVAFADSDNVCVAENHAIRRALFARPDPRALLEQMIDPATRIVTLSVTEKGYYLKPASGELLRDDPDIVHDVEHAYAPLTAPGLVLEALRGRRESGIAPFTVICCDNMPRNGLRTRDAVTSLAYERDRDLASWIEDHVPFPSTMVDRIVPSVTDELSQRIRSLIGSDDEAAVACEAFSQWVIEDRFSLGRPDWEAVGVEMVSDVAPYEVLKLRMLNGAHSLIAYDGMLAGKKTVDEAISDPRIAARVEAFFEETSASVKPVAGIAPMQYARSVIARFANDALPHRLEQIAADGSQKIPQRWLNGALANLSCGAPVSATAYAVAAWISYLQGGASNRWQVKDPMSDALARKLRENQTPGERVGAILGIEAIFPRQLATDERFRRAVTDAYATIRRD